MSYDNYYKRRGGRENSCHSHSRDYLDNTIDSRVLFYQYPTLEHVWNYETGIESISSCPVHGSSHSIWRLVRQDSRESRAVFEHDNKPPCPVHQPIPSHISMDSVGCVNTAVLNDDIITVEPEPNQEPEPPCTTNRSRHSQSRSKHSVNSNIERRHSVGSNVERQSSKASMCSMQTESKLRSSISSIGERPLYGKTLWNFFKSFCQQYPRAAMLLSVLIFLYFFIHQLDFTIAHGLECIIRFLYPISHYIAVTNEQFFARLSNMATRSDEMMEAVYCDFALSWCQRFGLMCEVQCSFVEKTLQRIRTEKC